MAKKTEQELRGILKNKDNKREFIKRVMFNADFGKGKYTSVVGVYDTSNGKQEFLKELTSYNSAPSHVVEYLKKAGKKEVANKHLSATKFEAYFENPKLPQNDEIEAVTFMPIKDSGQLQVRITFNPIRKTYFKEILFGCMKPEEALTIKMLNQEGELIATEKIYLTHKWSSLVYPVILRRGESTLVFEDNDNLSYTMDFNFSIPE